MEIRIWQSFSCNNSSSYRLVARFANPKVLKDAEAELNALFKEHAKQFDAKFEESDFEDYPREPTAAAAAFAKKNGFEWKKRLMIWGDEGLSGDEPELASEGNVLIIYHSYCGGGLPPEVNTYLEKRGAGIDKPKRGRDDDELAISALFKLPRDPRKAKALERLLAKTFRSEEEEEEEEDEDDDDGDDYEIEIEVPWASVRGRGGRNRYGKAAYFCDKKTVGFYYPLIPTDITALKTWLAKQGARDVRLRLCESADFKKFRAIAKAMKKCSECGAPQLEYLNPIEHNLDAEQLACKKCGGMFGLATFMGKKKKPKPKPKKMATTTSPKKKATKATKKKKSAAKRKKS